MSEKIFRVGPKTTPPPEPPRSFTRDREQPCRKCGSTTPWVAVLDPDNPERIVAHRCPGCGELWRHDKDRPVWDENPGSNPHPRRRKTRD